MASTSNSTSSKIITLRSSDGEVFEVEESVALESNLIRRMMEDDCANNIIPLPNVTAPVFYLVIEYCKKYAEMKDNKEKKKELRSQGEELLKSDPHTYSNLMEAVNYLDIKSLMDLTAQWLADFLKGKSPRLIRELLKIKNDFTPEEEAEILERNRWAFD